MISSEFVQTQREVFTNLTNLIVDHPYVDKWLIKINDEFNGRGLAQFSTECLSNVTDQDMNPQGKVISTFKKDVKVHIRKLLPAYLLPLTQTLFKNYLEFMNNLEVFGGIIEEVPNDYFKSIAAVGFIDPCGDFSFVTSYEKILQDKT